ncbi:MAG: T9SS type A sorting domain-containing protein [Flavobacteriales bacterium]
MKKFLHATLIAVLPGFAFGQTLIFEEDFDSYANGNLLAQTAGLPWTTWSDTPGTAEDTPISNEQALSGTLSAKFSGAAAGGPTDMVLRLGDRTSGSYLLGWSMYIPAGFGGYFNLQHNEVIGAGSWMMDVTLLPDNTVEFLVGGITTTGTYDSDTWFDVIMTIDLDQQTGFIGVGENALHTWQTSIPGPSRLGAVNFFAYAGGAPAVPSFYIDDVAFLDVGSVGVDEVRLEQVGIYPNPTTDLLTVELSGQAPSAIASLVDLTGRVVIDGRTFTQNGSVARTQMEMQGLPTGMYLLRLQDGERELVRRVTKL